MLNNEAGLELQADRAVPVQEAQVRAWLIDHLSAALEMDSRQIDPDAQFDRYGLDSSVAVNMVGELEDWLSCELSPTLPYDYPTVTSLARYLSQNAERQV